MACIYVIRCANSKYYVGRTIDVVSRYTQHRFGLGSKWTKAHQPLDGIIELLADTPFQELVTTLMYMSKYGIENVRGGPWTELVLSETEVKTIKEIMRSEGFARKDTSTPMDIDESADLSTTLTTEPSVGRKGKLWDANEEGDLMTQLNSCVSVESIAKMHSRTEGAIKTRVSQIAKRLREEGHQLAHIGNTLNITDEDVSKCLFNKTPDLVRFRRTETA